MKCLASGHTQICVAGCALASASRRAWRACASSHRHWLQPFSEIASSPLPATADPSRARCELPLLDDHLLATENKAKLPKRSRRVVRGLIGHLMAVGAAPSDLANSASESLRVGAHGRISCFRR